MGNIRLWNVRQKIRVVKLALPPDRVGVCFLTGVTPEIVASRKEEPQPIRYHLELF